MGRRPLIWRHERQTLAKAGGRACLAKLGREHFVELGRLGGAALRAKWKASGPAYESGTARLRAEVWQWLREEAAYLECPAAYLLREVVERGLAAYAEKPFRRPRQGGTHRRPDR